MKNELPPPSPGEIGWLLSITLAGWELKKAEERGVADPTGDRFVEVLDLRDKVLDADLEMYSRLVEILTEMQTVGVSTDVDWVEVLLERSGYIAVRDYVLGGE